MSNFMDAPAFPDRPDHPDFWRLSEILLQIDGRSNEDGREVFDEVSDNIDPASLIYMAEGRAKHGLQEFVAAKRDRVTTTDVVALVTAAWVEAFLVGARFQQRGGKQ